MSAITVHCPYCQLSLTLNHGQDYAPRFHDCPACKKRFIAERAVSGIKVMKEKEAPCMSNPECREIETASTCEQ